MTLAAPDAPPRPTLPELVRALPEPGPARGTTRGYRIGLALVALLVMLLPLVYGALVVAAGYATGWWLLNGWDSVELRSGRGRMFVFLMPLVLGAVVTFFLLKPFLAREPRDARPLELDPEQEPVLFGYVRALAERLGAPVPERIRVDLRLNASAGMRRPLLGWFRDDLVLTLGLPLVACADLGQLTGIVAHELGHFTQRAGMRASYLLGWATHWLWTGVHGRDAWDERLEDWSRSGGDWRLQGVLHVARGGVWLSRRVLDGLLRLARLASGHLSRQMEFDADAHAVRLVGPAVVEGMLDGLALWGMAESWAGSDLARAVERGELPANWAGLVASNLDQLPGDLRAIAVREGREETPHMYASHPPVQQRVEAAVACETRGRFELDLPASVLFRDLSALGQQLTQRAFRAQHGEAVHGFRTVATDELERSAADELARRRARDAWFGSFLVHVPIVPLVDAELEDLVRGHLPVTEGIEAMGAREQGRLGREAEKWSEQQDAAHASLALLGTLQPGRAARALGRQAPDPSTQERALRRATEALEGVEEQAAGQVRLGLARVARALRASRERTEPELQDARACTLAGLRHWCDLSRDSETARELLQEARVLAAVVQNWRGGSDEDPVAQLYVRRVRTARPKVLRLAKELHARPYPFEHADARATVGSVLLPQVPDRGEPGAVHDAAGRLGSGLHALVLHAMGEVALAGERLEALVAGGPAGPGAPVPGSSGSPE